MSARPFTNVLLRLSDDEVDKLDAYRRAQKSPPSRNRAGEEFFRRALNAHDWATKADKEADHAQQR
jgi:hypothetical protein